MRGSDFERIVGTGGWDGEGGQSAQPEGASPPPEESDEPPLPVMPVVYGAFAFAIISPIVAYFIFSGGPERRPRPAPGTQQQAQPAPNAPDPDRTRTITIRTKPSGAEVSIDDRRVGESPVDIDQSDIKYPATIYAELPDGRRLARTVEKQRRRVTLDFALVSPPKEDDGEQEDQQEESERGGRPSQRPDRSDDEDRPRQDPPTDDPAGSNDEGGSDLPPLDAPQKGSDSEGGNESDYPALDL